MQRQHTGRPDTHVLPHETAHRVVAERTMTAIVALRLPGAGPRRWDPVSQQNTADVHDAYWTGPARVQAQATKARRVTVADDDETTAGYLITLPATLLDDNGVPVATIPAEDHVVRVTNSGDPALDGRDLTVDQVVRGSVRFERDLLCSLTD
ncbi:DUF6093 family protein [Microcystis phage MinS1]|nr:DUF6093 family protein [Microcystis phage MinS1]